MPTLLVLDKDRLPGVLREELLAHEYSIVELRSGKNALEFIKAAKPRSHSFRHRHCAKPKGLKCFERSVVPAIFR